MFQLPISGDSFSILTLMSTTRFQCRESSIQECDVYRMGCWWPREVEALVEALLQ
jgi:hypothetical protein